MFGWLHSSITTFKYHENLVVLVVRKTQSKVNTNLNGEERALVVTGEMEQVLLMDIYPMQLLKACMIQDIERMEALGIYEVVPQDFALVDYASTSKIEAQEIIQLGLS